MAFTTDGHELTAHGLVEQLAGASIEVSDGTQTASTTIDDGFPQRDGATIALRATFGQSEANFEWRVHRVVTAAGLAVDEEQVDMGRKAPGAVWVLDIELQVA